MVLIDSLDLQDHQLAKAVVQAQDGAFQFEICEEQWPQQHKSRKEVLDASRSCIHICWPRLSRFSSPTACTPRHSSVGVV